MMMKDRCSQRVSRLVGGTWEVCHGCRCVVLEAASWWLSPRTGWPSLSLSDILPRHILISHRDSHKLMHVHLEICRGRQDRESSKAASLQRKCKVSASPSERLVCLIRFSVAQRARVIFLSLYRHLSLFRSLLFYFYLFPISLAYCSIYVF